MWQYELKNGAPDVWGAVEVGTVTPNSRYRSHRKQQLDVLHMLLPQAKELDSTVVATVNWGWFEAGRMYVSPDGDWLQESSKKRDKFNVVKGVF